MYMEAYKDVAQKQWCWSFVFVPKRPFSIQGVKITFHEQYPRKHRFSSAAWL